MHKGVVAIVSVMCLAFVALMVYFFASNMKDRSKEAPEVAVVSPKPTPPPARPQNPPAQDTPRQDTPRQDGPRQDTPRQDAPSAPQGGFSPAPPIGDTAPRATPPPASTPGDTPPTDTPPAGSSPKKGDANKPPEPEPEPEPGPAGTPTPKGTAPKVGNIVPEIEGVDVDGKKFKLSDYKGKVVVLDFWGFW